MNLDSKLLNNVFIDRIFMLTIRYYFDTDYQMVKALLQEAHLFDEVREAQLNLKRKISRDSQSIIVAEQEGIIVGCVFVVEDGWNAFLWRLAVKKNYRKQGIGLTLMQKAEEILKTRGYKEVSIFVDVKNGMLQQRYQKQNYLKTSDYTFMYKKLFEE